MLISFFGADGKKQLDLAHFGTFCRALHAELVRLEFLHYDHARKVVPFAEPVFATGHGQCPGLGGTVITFPHAMSSTLGLQGNIPGVSFAHSLASHTHAQTVDAYLDIIDQMPESLKSAKVRPECRKYL